MQHYKSYMLIASLSIILFCNVLFAGDSSDINLTVNPIPGSDLVEFRCVTVVRSTLGGVVSLFEDIDSMPQWVYRMKSAKNLKRISPTVVIAYTLIYLPWPLEDRDSVLYTTIKQDKSGILRIEGTDYPGFLPVQKGIVRMNRVHSVWQFEPLPDGYLRVVFSGTGDPGGVIPLNIFNSFVNEAPYQTMKKFCEMIKREKYQSMVVPFIREFPKGASGFSK